MLLDPAMLNDLQAATLPPLAPPAFERAWVAPSRTGAAASAYIDAVEARAVQWRADLDVWADAFGRCRDVPRSVGELAVLDRMARKIGLAARGQEREAERWFKRRLRWHEEVAARDASEGQAFLALVKRMRSIQLADADALARLAAATRTYRDSVDYRGRATFNADERDFRPNAETIEAMEAARAGVGMRRMASVADLMAEMDAEVD